MVSYKQGSGFKKTHFCEVLRSANVPRLISLQS